MMDLPSVLALTRQQQPRDQSGRTTADDATCYVYLSHDCTPPWYRVSLSFGSLPTYSTSWRPARRRRGVLIAALEPFLQVPVACRRPLRCHPADDGHEGHADAVPLEIKCERHTRPCAVVERFDGDVRVWPDRSSDTVHGPARGGIDLRYLLGHRALDATDPASCGEL